MDQQPTPRSFRLQAWSVFAGALLCSGLALGLPKGGSSAPGGFLYDAQGQPAMLGEHLAPITLVHFWATWCPPCISEIPSLSRLEQAVQSPDFVILYVAVDDDVQKVQGFLGTATGNILFDPSWEVAHRYDTYKVPETVLLVGNEVVDKFIGAQDWDSAEVRRRLEEKVRSTRGEGLAFASS